MLLIDFFLLGYDTVIYKKCGLVLVAHACNPCYSGDRRQEDCSRKPVPANSLQDF
jgi:hypothetical protein